MDKQTLLQSLAGTLDSSHEVRNQSEKQLHVFEEQPGFTEYLLDLITEDNIPLGIQISAAIFFKNRIVQYWVVPDNKAASPRHIREQEKNGVKEKLVQTLIKTYRNNQLKLQLTTALHNIVDSEKWSELIDISKSLLNDTANVDHVYTALLCVYEYTRNYRLSGFGNNDSNPVLEEVSTEVFPLLENLASQLVSSESEEPLSDEMLYLIIKIFKFTTFSSLPSYFHDPAKLSAWFQLHILIINKPLPASVLNEESLDLRAQNPRIKTIKWCFGNLHRFLSRHGGGISTKDKKNNQFAAYFLQNFVPEILNSYWKIIEDWSTRKVWLSESSLYHLISFLEQLLETPAKDLVYDKLDAVIRHVVIPNLSSSEEIIELYEDDPEEYMRRFFDINREGANSDIASINLIFRLASNKNATNTVLNILNEIFNKRAADRNDLAVAMQTEGALRVLTTMAYKLDKKSSPVHGQVDTVLYTFVYPELSAETAQKTPWLTARACDTIAMFDYKYKNMQILQDIFQAVVGCFQNEAQFPVQIIAVDALSTLVSEDLVAEQVSQQIPQVMGTILEMSKRYESDILTSAMEIFVEKFPQSLQPFAHELASKLVEQFMAVAQELLENSNASDDVVFNKEYKASAILSTLTTLVVSLSSSPEVAHSMEDILKGTISCILENAMVAFLTEAIEILESILFNTRKVSPTMWGLFESVISVFDVYAFDYFDSFQPFFESIVNYGFTDPELDINNPYVQSLLKLCYSNLTKDGLDPIFVDSTFEILELAITALNQRFVSILPGFLNEIFTIFSTLESQDAFDGYMLRYLSVIKVFFAAIYIDPVTTIQFLNEKGFTANFFKLWMKDSVDFQSVYGCKLQILASVSIIKTQAINLLPEDLVGETTDLLLSCISALPNAIRVREELLNREKSSKVINAEADNDDDENDDEFGGEYYDDELEADEAELEAMKQTPIDTINVFQVFTNAIMQLQNEDPSKYQVLFGGIDQDQKDLIDQMIKITTEQTQRSGN